MAQAVDGAMIWGGAEAVSQLRKLPFLIGTRRGLWSKAFRCAMDAETWGDRAERASWCRRIARDVWQFDHGRALRPSIISRAKCRMRSDEFVND